MAASVARASCIGLAGLALALGGCAFAPPPGAGPAGPSCDLICHVLRLLDLEAPPPQPAALPPPAATPDRPKAVSARPSRKIAGRHVRPLAEPAAPAEARPADLAVAPTDNGTVVPTAATATTSPLEAAPDASGPWLHTLAGSPPIAPPWFEPWTPATLRP